MANRIIDDMELEELMRDKRALRQRLRAEYDRGYRDAQYFFRSYSDGYDENENDENFND